MECPAEPEVACEDKEDSGHGQNRNFDEPIGQVERLEENFGQCDQRSDPDRPITGETEPTLVQEQDFPDGATKE